MLDLGVNIYGGEVLSSIFFNSRFFTDLQASLLQHYVLDNTVTLSGDFEIEFDFLLPEVGVTNAILGDSPSAHDVLIRADGAMRISGSSFITFNSVMPTGVLNKYRIVRTSGVVSGFINGTGDGGGSMAGDFTFSRIGADSSNYFNGIIANLKITDQGVLTHDLPIDEDRTNDVVVNHVSGSLGGELFTDFDSPIGARGNETVAVVNGRGRATATTTSTFGISYAITGLTIGKAYLVESAFFHGTATGPYWPRIGTNSDLGSGSNIELAPNSTEDVVSEVLFTATATTHYIGIVSTAPTVGDYIEMGKPSVRQATGYATAAAITSDSAELFTQVGDDWIGEELANSSTFNFTTTSNFEQVPQVGSGDLVVGNTYKATAINATANTFRFRPFAGSYVSSLDLTADAQTSGLTWQGNQIGDYELSNISVKRLLEVAP